MVEEPQRLRDLRLYDKAVDAYVRLYLQRLTTGNLLPVHDVEAAQDRMQAVHEVEAAQDRMQETLGTPEFPAALEDFRRALRDWAALGEKWTGA